MTLRQLPLEGRSMGFTPGFQGGQGLGGGDPALALLLPRYPGLPTAPPKYSTSGRKLDKNQHTGSSEAKRTASVGMIHV